MTRDRLLENLRWPEEGSSKYAGASEESQREMFVHPMDEHFSLNYVDAQDAPDLFDEVCVRYSS